MSLRNLQALSSGNKKVGLALSDKPFVHLHVHSQYSLLEATCDSYDLAKRAAEFQMPALALTDLGNMFGAIEFYFACKSNNVKPILGLEVFMAPKGRLVKEVDRDSGPLQRLVLLAQSKKGYQNLCRISTIGFQEGFYYRPRVDEEVLKELNGDLICLTGGLTGMVPQTFLQMGEEKALEKIRGLKQIFDDRFYLELNRTGVADWNKINPFILEAGKITGVPTVAANDVHYLNQDDQLAQEILICIGSNRTLQDETRFRLGTDQFYLKDAKQMRELFKDQQEACDRTLEIAERCNVQFKLKDDKGQPIYHLPSYPTQGGVPLNEEIARLSKEGLEERFLEAEKRGETISEERKQDYYKRLDYELSVIDRMGFNGYFLIVQDFIGWAKSHGIPVGPGRGSGAGSIVAYSLRITDLDPMPYNLLFERFLNPERISMPDFDIDFCQEHRGRVIQYVTEKYGSQSVGQIITYGKLQTRAAIRDVGRVMGMTFTEVDVVSKLIPEKLGITLDEAIETEPRLREMMDQDPKIQNLMDFARKIEGLVRHAGIHAAGVIIADGNIIDHAPLYKGADGENVVQYDMKHAEKIGLIKFDFLGLKTLTHIQDALSLIEKNRGKKFTTQDISLSDKGVYSLMSKGDTAGVFQFEGEGITDLMRKAKPTCFEDIVAINALYRPGPMDMIPDYLARKQGEKKVDYIFDELESVLKETYGIVVYQEQVQLVAAKIANYSLGEADMLRRAMGKKIAEEMAQQKARFLKGAEENKHDAKKAEALFDLMAEFAKYGFNKSHAAAYCVVAAHTAWLKNYYPVEFFAALLSTEMSDTDKVVKYVKDAKRHNIEVVPPHINHSEYKFSVEGDKILFSMGAIKGVGEGAVESILTARAQQPNKKFADLETFFEAVDLRKVNKKTIEALIKAGALDGFGYNRRELSDDYSRFIDSAARNKEDKAVGQTSLFAMDDAGTPEKIQLNRADPWTKSQSLFFEREVLGFYLSQHPLSGFEPLANIFSCTSVDKIADLPKDAKIHLLGMVGQYREIITKKGTRMAFTQIEDQTGSVEGVCFPDLYAKAEKWIKSDSILLIAAHVDDKDGSKKLILDGIKNLDEALKTSRRLTVHFLEDEAPLLENLGKLVKKNPGSTSVVLKLHLPKEQSVVELDSMSAEGITANKDFIQSLIGEVATKKGFEIGF